MPFQDYWVELSSAIPRLPPLQAQKLVNRAWSDIRDMRLWSWQIQFADLYAPNLISVGTVNVTQFSTTVTADSTAAAAFQSVALAQPPLASTILGQGRQFRAASGGLIGPIAGGNSYNEIPSGTINGSNLVFTLANAPSPANSLQLYRNGLLQQAGVDFSLYNNIITFLIYAPIPGDILLATYQFGVNQQQNTLLGATAGPIYNIIGFDGNNKLTLDRPYYGGSGNITYMVYRCYYAPPTPDFIRYASIVNTASGYAIGGRDLYADQSRLNQLDAQRGTFGDAYLLSPFRPDNTGQVVHEFYPHPQNATVYNGLYRRRGMDLSPSQDIPATFPSSVLMSMSYIHACQWALENIAQYPELEKTNWVLAKQAREKELFGMPNRGIIGSLIRTIRQDDELSPMTAFKQGSRYNFVYGGQFMQNHDISGFLTTQ